MLTQIRMLPPHEVHEPERVPDSVSEFRIQDLGAASHSVGAPHVTLAGHVLIEVQVPIVRGVDVVSEDSEPVGVDTPTCLLYTSDAADE